MGCPFYDLEYPLNTAFELPRFEVPSGTPRAANPLLTLARTCLGLPVALSGPSSPCNAVSAGPSPHGVLAWYSPRAHSLDGALSLLATNARTAPPSGQPGSNLRM
jgi:hypothetical protein